MIDFRDGDGGISLLIGQQWVSHVSRLELLLSLAGDLRERDLKVDVCKVSLLLSLL